MKSILVLTAIFLISCSSAGLITINSTVKLKTKDGIDSAKARTIASQFLESERKRNIQGRVVIEKFEEKYKKQCNEHPVALKEYGKFCNAHYVISHSSDPFCIGESRVLEICASSQCFYEISKYMEICE